MAYAIGARRRVLFVVPALLVGALLFPNSASRAQQPERRIALVIGNSSYDHYGVLPNPDNDAKLIAERLVAADFEVVGARLDLGVTAFREAVQEFGRLTKEREIAVFYFSGHGLEVDGQNYLLPVDAKVTKGGIVNALTLNFVLGAIEGAKKLRVVILDACRDNPFVKAMVEKQAVQSVGSGLANIEPAGEVLVAYAAKHGTKASDGRGGNSPYAKALAEELTTQGLDVRLMFSKVRDRVLQETAAYAELATPQEPFTYGSIGGQEVALVPWRAETTTRSRPIFPDSSSRELGIEDLAPLSCGELYLARNEIFDRNGFCFSTQRGRVNFDNAGCTTTRQDVITSLEKANVDKIRQQELAKSCRL